MPGGAVKSGIRRLLRPVRRFVARFSLVDEETGRVAEELRTEHAALAARLGPEMERLRAEARRIQRENAAVVRLMAGPPGDEGALGDVMEYEAEREGGDGGTGSAGPAVLVLPHTRSVSGRGFFAEIERGSRQEVAEKVENYTPPFDRGPILDLGCGRGAFLAGGARRGLPAE